MSHMVRWWSWSVSSMIACTVLACAGAPAYGQSIEPSDRLDARAIIETWAAIDSGTLPEVRRESSYEQVMRPAHSTLVVRSRDEGPRPKALVPLYVSFGALQALDAHSTLRAIGDGHSEQNPFVGTFTTAPGAMVGLKLASTAGTILLTERLWRRHRGAAIALMIAVNGAYAAVVLHNYRVR